MMKIFHIADTHIGYSAYRRTDEASGLNQREVDTYEAFRRFVDFAVQEKEKPDLIMHAGDLFDSVRPSNRAISFVLGQLLRLSEAGIPFVAISGNHETPRLKETGSVLSLFEHIPGVRLVYEGRYEVVEIPDLRLKIHAIPHSDDIEREKKKMKLRAGEGVGEGVGEGFNVALLHASVLGAGLPAAASASAFLMHEFNEQVVSIDDLTGLGLDYIALGHFHRPTRVRAGAYYAGSTERFSFSEANDQKGFLEVRLREREEREKEEENSKNKREVVFHRLRTREMLDLEPVVCSGLDEQGIKSALKRRIRESNPEGKVVRLKVQGIPLHIYHSLDFDELKRLTRSAVHFELKYEFQRQSGSELFPAAERPSFRSLKTEFEEFVEKYAVAGEGAGVAGSGIKKARLKELGLRYLREGGEEGERGEGSLFY
ncbi:hypothetical protein B6V00_05210 [ANME-1 cluster archaeon ex4572_4]|nr:MAG: hypothetical protein B6V00_05210 [ANME-1 cluster archaeon ex4572_4]